MLQSEEVCVKLKWFGGFFFFPEEDLIDPVYFEEYFDTSSLNFEQFKVYMNDAINFIKDFDFDLLQYDKLQQLQRDDRIEYDKTMFNLKKHLISCEFLNDRYKSKIYNYETTNYIDRVSAYPMPKYIKWFQVECESEKVDWNRIPSESKKKIVYDALTGESDNMSGEVSFTTTYRMAKRFNAFCSFPLANDPKEKTPDNRMVPHPTPVAPLSNVADAVPDDTKVVEKISDGLELVKDDDDDLMPFVKGTGEEVGATAIK